MKPKHWGLVLFVALGVAKVPLEDAMAHSLRAQRLQMPPPDLGWQENFGQMVISTLGGLRNLVASVTYLEAYGAWENLDWGRVDTLMALTTRLQPTEPTYWDEASWHMAYNAASNYLKDKDLRFAIKHKLYRDHVQRGIAILEEGLKFNPEDPLLLQRLGEIYQNRQPDPRLSAKYFLEAHKHGARDFYERVAAYQLVKLSDRASWEQAYEILKRYYDHGKPFNTMGSILRDLPILEERLNIPTRDRIRPARPFVPQIPGSPPR